jgi:hypothetical protein
MAKHDTNSLRLHSELFLELVLRKYNFGSLDEARRCTGDLAHLLKPVVINDFHALTEQNKTELSGAYASPHGVAYFIVRNPETKPVRPHALFDIVEQLKSVLPVSYPLSHPLEGHQEAVERFGPPDGTVKIYNLPKDPSTGYREQAETDEMFDMHHDGLGSGGTVQTVALYMDSPPLFGGCTYFQNVPLRAVAMAASDREAFESLFSPRALTIIRPRGKGAIKVITPVLFVNDSDCPQSFFRVASGEYTVTWDVSDPLSRARAFLTKYIPPFALGSSFVHFSSCGHGCLINNQLIAHARTSFKDDAARGLTRVLSRKWFMRTERDSKYKHVPGMFVSERFAPAYETVCNPASLEGEWLYNSQQDTNMRQS